MKICNTMQNSGNIVHFLDQNLKIKNGRKINIMNEILWIYGRELKPTANGKSQARSQGGMYTPL